MEVQDRHEHVKLQFNEVLDKWEVVKQVMVYFADVEPFLWESEHFGPHLRLKLHTYLLRQPSDYF